jgi:hypothetical protein
VHKLGDLMPVEAVGVDIRQRPGIPSRFSCAARQLCTSSPSSPIAFVVPFTVIASSPQLLSSYPTLPSLAAPWMSRHRIVAVICPA